MRGDGDGQPSVGSGSRIRSLDPERRRDGHHQRERNLRVHKKESMKTTGARVLAEMLDGYEVTHIFHVPAILRRTMAELEARTGIKRIRPHGEKPAAYMADGYARASGKPGICMAQIIGAQNLAAGLRDAY